MTTNNPAESINHTWWWWWWRWWGLIFLTLRKTCRYEKLIEIERIWIFSKTLHIPRESQQSKPIFSGLCKVIWLASIEPEWRKWGSSTKVDFESSCLFLLLAACCKSEVGNFLFLQGKVFNQISSNRWLTNSQLDKQRTLRILNMVGCHIWIRKGDILELFFCRIYIFKTVNISKNLSQ